MKYPLSVIILGQIWAGWTMVSLDVHVPAKFDVFYPWHKSFGMLTVFRRSSPDT